jgi:glycosyltransferase involved in cell wall biosynthesis
VKKRLLFITTRIFWPTDSGHKVVLYNYCKGLNERFGYDICIYSFLEAGQDNSTQDKPDFIADVRIAADISQMGKAKNILHRSILSRRKLPLQCSLYHSRRNSAEIERYCKEISPSVIFVDMIRLASYYESFSKLPCAKILYMEDALSRRYERQMEYKSAMPVSAVGQYAGNLPRFANKMLSANAIRDKVLKMEVSRLKKAELLYSRLYDYVVLVSDVDKGIFGAENDNIVTATIGVESEYYAEDTNETKIENTISYIGNMNVAANADTLHMILNDVLPLISSKPKMYVVGNCPQEIVQMYSQRNDIIFCGRVDDTRKYIKSTQVMLCPIAYGTGIKTKILEAMCMGMPVVTNSVGAEGIAARNGMDFFVMEDYAEMARITDRLLEDRELCNAVGENARKFIMENHTWDRAFVAFGEMGM